MLNFTPREDIERLVDSYLQYDIGWQMRQKNGMTREMFINGSILNEFLNDNEKLDSELDRDLRGMPTRESLLVVAKQCAGFYSVKPEDLVEDYIKHTGTDYLDADERERIEKGFRELLGERESNIRGVA